MIRRTVTICALSLVLLAAACSSDPIETSLPAGTADEVALPTPVEPTAVPQAAACEAFPSYSEGVFYLNDSTVVRSDATEDIEGLPLFVRVTLVDAATCDRLDERVVDVWSANPEGRYSGVINQGDPDGTEPDDERWLRARQTTNDKGTIEISTIYPGWVAGSPPHLTMTTPIDDEQSFTWRVALDDVFSEQVYAEEPYVARGEHPVRSETAAESGSIASPVRRGDGALIELVVAIDANNLRQRPVSADILMAPADPADLEPDETSFTLPERLTLSDQPTEIREMFAVASQELDVDADELFDSFRIVANEPPPDVAQIAEDLGVTQEALAQALPLVAAGAPTLD